MESVERRLNFFTVSTDENLVVREVVFGLTYVQHTEQK